MILSKRDYGAFYEKSVASNPSCRNIYNATKAYFVRKNISKMVLFGEQMIARNCVLNSKRNEVINGLLKAEVILYTNKLNFEQKEKYFLVVPKKVKSMC